MNLFRVIAEPSKTHPNFRRAMHSAYKGARDVLSSWAEEFVDRDGKFVHEFQTTFNSGFWELYVFAALKRFGFTPDLSFRVPDFVITHPYAFCIEAVIAQAAQGSCNEWERKLESFWGDLQTLVRTPLVDQATVRLANAISGKNEKFETQYSKLDHVRNKPFVIAVAPFEQPFFYLQLNKAILRVLFGYDGQPPESAEQVNQEHKARWTSSIRKPNGAEIPLGYFTNAQMPNISAVLFSNTATFGKLQALSTDSQYRTMFQVFRFDASTRCLVQKVHEKEEYQESLLDGLSVFYNPFATYALPRALFGGSEVAHYSYDAENGILRFDVPNNALFHRLAATIAPKD
jgi:hypothetical protein